MRLLKQGGKYYCTMCAIFCLKHQAVFAALAADVTAPAEGVAVPTAVAKAIPSAPTPGAVSGKPALVAKKAKPSKASAPATLDESAVHGIGGANDGPRPPPPIHRRDEKQQSTSNGIMH